MASKSTQQDWLRGSSKLTFVKCFLITFVCFAILAIVHINGGKNFVYNRVVNPLQFKLRNKVFTSADIDKNIKILAVDQETMNSIGLEAVPVDDWIALFRSLGKLKPKAVFIDKVFALPMTTDPKKMKELVEAINSIPKITAGAVYSQYPMLATELKKNYLQQDISQIKQTAEFVYGPRKEIVEAFDFVGHTNYEEYGLIRPIVNTSKGVPVGYWGLFGEPVEVKGKEVFVNGNNLYLNESDQIVVNLLDPKVYQKKTYSLKHIFDVARKNQLVGITPQDTIIILTSMHQGSTNFQDTPAGSMAIGYVMTEVVNSALQARWLKYVGHELLFLPLFCILGFLIGFSFTSVRFWLILLFSQILLTSIGFGAFCYFNILLPWAFQNMAVFLTALAIYVEKTRLADMKAQAIQYSLEGMIDPSKLQNIINNSEGFKIEPKNQVLTVMFIDIAGFSSLAEKETPTQVFNYLRNLMVSISDIVHKNGGIIDRSLGDGLLCFFGYQFEDSKDQDNAHIKQAVDCAIEIQKMALAMGHAALKNKEPIFPLRIGLNTGEVYAGDIGGSHKIDFTIIGHSVNFAQRMESACENYKIMCGAATFENLQDQGDLKKSFIEKYISIKHYTSLVKAYEVDPFYGDAKSKQDCEELRRAFDKNSRSHERFTAPEEWAFSVHSEDGLEGKVINFSKSGLEVSFNKYLGRSANINFILKLNDQQMERDLQNSYLDSFSAEVRWAMQVSSGEFRTGIKFKNLTDNQKEAFLSLLTKQLPNNQ